MSAEEARTIDGGSWVSRNWKDAVAWTAAVIAAVVIAIENVGPK